MLHEVERTEGLKALCKWAAAIGQTKLITDP